MGSNRFGTIEDVKLYQRFLRFVSLQLSEGVPLRSGQRLKYRTNGTSDGSDCSLWGGASCHERFQTDNDGRGPDGVVCRFCIRTSWRIRTSWCIRTSWYGPVSLSSE